MDPLVSVVIAAFNASKWIAATIDSVLAQDFSDFEIVVVDDGSTDDTASVVTEFGGRINYIRQLNAGQPAARNVGIRHARGQYVAFVDADDLWSPNKLGQQITQLVGSSSAWVYCDAYAFDGQTGRTMHRFGFVSPQHQGDVLESLYLHCFIPPPTPVIRRSVFDEVGYFDEDRSMQYGEDWNMWLKIAARYPVALVPQPLAYYRVHSTSMTGGEDPQVMLQGHLKVIEEAARREPVRLNRYKSQAIANRYRDAGMIFARSGRLTLARQAFMNSIRLYPLKIEPYAHLAGCLIGGWPLSAAIRTRYWLRRMRSANK